MIKTYRIYELDHTSSETYVKKQDHDEIVKKLVEALKKIANDEEEDAHERAENALWEARGILKEMGEL